MYNKTLFALLFLVLTLTQCQKNDLTTEIVGTYVSAQNDSVVISKVDDKTILVDYLFCCPNAPKATMNSTTAFDFNHTISNESIYRFRTYGFGKIIGDSISINLNTKKEVTSTDSLISIQQTYFGGIKVN